MQRTRAIIAAALAALVTGTVLFLYVRGANERAAAAESPVSVLVARALIPESTPFDIAYNANGVAQVKMPKRLVPPTAVFNPTELQGQVAAGSIAVGQVIVKEGWGKPEDLGSAASALAKRIPDGRVAVTFSAGGQAAVAGLIQPGDHVNLLIQVPDLKAIGQPESKAPAVVTVFQNLEVFALGTTPLADTKSPPSTLPGQAPAPVVAVSGTLYTVLVDPKDATRLVILTTQFPVTLGLVNPNYQPRDIPPQILTQNPLPDGLTPDLSAAKH
jgi:pilus assembly protein CpaB